MKYGEQSIAESTLEIWENPVKQQEYTIEIVFNEFTCLCPRSGFPDFGSIKIMYTPKNDIIELRSLKLYLNKFRNEYITHEEATNKIWAELNQILNPIMLEITGEFNIRGGLKTKITVCSKPKKNN